MSCWRQAGDDILVWSLDEQHQACPGADATSSRRGQRKFSGSGWPPAARCKATANHPFLTFSAVDATGGSPARRPGGDPTPDPGAAGHRSGLAGAPARAARAPHRRRLRASKRQPMHYTSNDPENLAFVEAAAAADFGISPRPGRSARLVARLPARADHCTHGRGNPIHAGSVSWASGIAARTKSGCPRRCTRPSDAEIACSCGICGQRTGASGCRRKAAAKIYYATSSRELAAGVAHLLPRFGIVARIRRWRRPDTSPGIT